MTTPAEIRQSTDVIEGKARLIAHCRAKLGGTYRDMTSVAFAYPFIEGEPDEEGLRSGRIGRAVERAEAEARATLDRLLEEIVAWEPAAPPVP